MRSISCSLVKPFSNDRKLRDELRQRSMKQIIGKELRKRFIVVLDNEKNQTFPFTPVAGILKKHVLPHGVLYCSMNGIIRSLTTLTGRLLRGPRAAGG